MRRISQMFFYGVMALVACSSALTYAHAAMSHSGVLTDYEASYNEGISRYDRGDYSGAIADFTKALEQSPHFAEAYYNRGLAKYQHRDTRRLPKARTAQLCKRDPWPRPGVLWGRPDQLSIPGLPGGPRRLHQGPRAIAALCGGLPWPGLCPV